MRILTGIIAAIVAIGIAGGFETGGMVTVGKLLVFFVCMLAVIFFLFFPAHPRENKKVNYDPKCVVSNWGRDRDYSDYILKNKNQK